MTESTYLCTYSTISAGNNNKYMIALTQITNTENFAVPTALVFKLLSRKVLFINTTIETVKVIVNFTSKLLKDYK